MDIQIPIQERGLRRGEGSRDHAHPQTTWHTPVPSRPHARHAARDTQCTRDTLQARVARSRLSRGRRGKGLTGGVEIRLPCSCIWRLKTWECLHSIAARGVPAGAATEAHAVQGTPGVPTQARAGEAHQHTLVQVPPTPSPGTRRAGPPCTCTRYTGPGTSTRYTGPGTSPSAPTGIRAAHHTSGPRPQPGGQRGPARIRSVLTCRKPLRASARVARRRTGPAEGSPRARLQTAPQSLLVPVSKNGGRRAEEPGASTRTPRRAWNRHGCWRAWNRHGCWRHTPPGFPRSTHQGTCRVSRMRHAISLTPRGPRATRTPCGPPSRYGTPPARRGEGVSDKGHPMPRQALLSNPCLT
jgi:hypothetical protein